MLVEALEKVVDRLIGLLHQREVRRSVFFHEIVVPIQDVFVRFRNEHVATFDAVRRALRDSSVPVEDIRTLLLDKTVLEAGSWRLFAKLDPNEVTSKINLQDHYATYLASLQRCLVEVRPSRSPEGLMGIEYYDSLVDQIEHVLRSVYRTAPDSGGQAERVGRAEALAQVDNIVSRFHEYCAEVDAHYMRLKQYCLV